MFAAIRLSRADDDYADDGNDDAEIANPLKLS